MLGVDPLLSMGQRENKEKHKILKVKGKHTGNARKMHTMENNRLALEKKNEHTHFNNQGKGNT